MSTLERLLDPASIAIAGVSADEGKHGSRVLANLRRLAYQGEIWGVNPGLPQIPGLDVFPSVEALPGAPDLLVAAVPAGNVVDLVSGCEGVGGVVVFASGFAESGPAGRELENRLIDVAADAGIRFLGPNSGGIIRPDRGLAASFLTCLDRPREQIRSGPVAVVTQSGGTGSYLHNLAAARSEGIAVTVSTGNEADIKLGEAIEAVSNLGDVEVILAIVETMRDGSVFIETVHQAHARGQRVVVCPIGTGVGSETLLASHTGAMAVPAVISRGVFDALGVVTTETPAEGYEVATMMAHSGRVSGPRVGVVTHSGGMAILLSDLAERLGVSLPDPSPTLGATVGSSLDHGSAANPVDMGGIIGGPGRFAEVVGGFAKSGEYDVVLAVSTAHPPSHTAERVETLLDLPKDIPILHLWMTGDQGEAGLSALRDAALPVTEEPRSAIRAIAGLTHHPGPAPSVPPIGGPPETWGLPLDAGVPAGSPEQASSSAATLGFPVVVKLDVDGVAHKTETGGVFLDLRNAGEVERAHHAVMDIATRLGLADARSRIQRYRPGVEMILGGLIHPSFGPLISVGMGGVFAEVLGDVVFSPAPVDADAAEHMIGRLQGRHILEGYRGAPSANRAELARMISLVSRGIVGSGLESFEMNPLIWDGEEWVAVDWLTT